MSHPTTTITKGQCLSFDYTREPGLIWVKTTNERYPELRLTSSEVRLIMDRGAINW